MQSHRNHRPLYAYFGHHKCASMWIREIIADVCAMTNMRLALISRADDLPDADVTRFVEERRPDFLVYSNADLRHVQQLGALRGFHVIRDPRDLIVSAYFSHRYSHPIHSWPGLAEHRRQLSEVDKTQGLLLEIAYSARVIKEIMDWNYADPNILELRMENLITNPYEGFVHIFEFLGLTRRTNALIDSREQVITIFLAAFHRWRTRTHLQRAHAAAQRGAPQKMAPSRWPRVSRRYVTSANVLQAVYRNRFERKSGGRHAGEENERSHYRKGTAGDWANHFEEVHVREFKRRFNDGLLALGYEQDPDWNITHHVGR